MNNRAVVSVLVPCYNVEKKMKKFMESILYQTYPALELVFVDDGSTDRTKDIIKSYTELYEEKGYVVKYIYQNNMGLGGAINTGLKILTGQYVIWPDPDDWLEKDSIEKRVNFLEEHLDYAVVTSNARMHFANELEEPGKPMFDPIPQYFYNENQFTLLLRYKSVFCSNCHMIRMSDFLLANPKRDIFPARRGQNFQMLLPIYYRGKRFFMNEILCHYVIYEDSMSRGDDTLEKLKIRFDGLKEIVLETLQRIDMAGYKRVYYILLVCWDDTVKRIKTYSFWTAKRLISEKTWEKLKRLFKR